MRNISLLAALAILAGVSSWVLALGLGVNSACSAYHATANVEDFAHFAYPYVTAHEGKVSYLFGPTIGVFLAGVLFLSVRSRWLEEKRWGQLYLLSSLPLRAILLAIGAFLLLQVTHDRANRAITASEKIHWHGVSEPNNIVDFACGPFG